MNATFFAPPLELDVQPDRTRAETDANASATPAVRVSFMVLSSLSSGYQDIVTATYNTRTATVPPHSPGCRQLRRDPLVGCRWSDAALMVVDVHADDRIAAA